jgi:hypothetical protein
MLGLASVGQSRSRRERTRPKYCEKSRDVRAMTDADERCTGVLRRTAAYRTMRKMTMTTPTTPISGGTNRLATDLPASCIRSMASLC